MQVEQQMVQQLTELGGEQPVQEMEEEDRGARQQEREMIGRHAKVLGPRAAEVQTEPLTLEEERAFAQVQQAQEAPQCWKLY